MLQQNYMKLEVYPKLAEILGIPKILAPFSSVKN